MSKPITSGTGARHQLLRCVVGGGSVPFCGAGCARHRGAGRRGPPSSPSARCRASCTWARTACPGATGSPRALRALDRAHQAGPSSWLQAP